MRGELVVSTSPTITMTELITHSTRTLAQRIGMGQRQGHTITETSPGPTIPPRHTGIPAASRRFASPLCVESGSLTDCRSMVVFTGNPASYPQYPVSSVWSVSVSAILQLKNLTQIVASTEEKHTASEIHPPANHGSRRQRPHMSI